MERRDQVTPAYLIAYSPTILPKDPHTQLMYDNDDRPGLLCLSKKLEILNQLPEHYPNVAYVLKILGVSRLVYERHLRIDPVFRQRIKELEMEVTDEVEFQLRKHAKGEKNFMDRIAWLRAHRPEKYMETSRIIVDKYATTPEEARAKESRLSECIDAEFVDARVIQTLENGKEPHSPVIDPRPGALALGSSEQVAVPLDPGTGSQAAGSGQGNTAHGAVDPGPGITNTEA